MALSFEDTKKLEEIKQKHKKEIMELSDGYHGKEHERRMNELNKQLEIAKAGGTK